MSLRAPIPSPAVPIRVTPHGGFNAPRYVINGGSTAKAPSPDAKPDHYHQGIDVVAPAGSPVVACGPGVIMYAEPGLGKTVCKIALCEADGSPFIWQGQRLYAVYADLGDVTPEGSGVGHRVGAGDVIATVWKEGFVHFALRLGVHGYFIDPAKLGLEWTVTGLAVG